MIGAIIFVLLVFGGGAVVCVMAHVYLVAVLCVVALVGCVLAALDGDIVA